MQSLDISTTIARAQTGCAAAIGELYAAYADALKRFCYAQLRDQLAAEDCVQDTWVCVWKAIQNFEYRDEPSFVGWLYTIARNQLVSYIRKQERTAGSCSIESVPEPKQADTSRVICDRLALTSALDRLTKKQRQVIVLKFFVGLSNLEIAGIVCSTEGGVKLLQMRALASLRRIMHESVNLRSLPA